MLNVNEVTRLYLGIQGENLTRPIIIDVKPWLMLYPEGSVSIWHKRNGDLVPAPTGAVFDDEEGTVTWTPTSTDTYVDGEGEAEIRLTVGTVIKKSRSIITGVSPAVTGAGVPLGSDWQSYIDEVERIKGLAVTAKQGAETAQGLAEDAQEAAETAQGKAEDAQEAAETAQGKAEDAQEAAETAQGKAEDAQEAAETAQGKAEDAQTAAETAQGKAEDAQTAAETAQGKAEDAQEAAETAQGKAEDAQEAAETAQGKAEDAQGAAEDARDEAAEWATGGTTGTPGATNNAKYYAEQAEAAGAEQIALIEAAGADEIDAIEDKGDEVLESIPEDYTTLSNTVSDLSSAFNEFSGVNGISGQSINGSANIETPITETITQNNYWYPTGSGTIANGGAKEGMDKAVFDITNVSGKIAIGFDPNASYGSGSMVVGLSSSAVSPYTRVTYFSVSNVQSTTNYFAVNGNVVTVDLDALKSAYPTAVLMFVNVPHNVWKLDNITTFKKTLHWLSIAGYVPSIVVAADGSGDYTTITEAISAASNGDTIYIKDGEYKETVVVNKYVHLVGQSKQGTILYQDIGNYNNCPILITQGSVCNMTIKSLAPSDTSGLSNYAYAIHLDRNFASLAKYQKCEIYNCDIYSEVNDAIGAGTNYASEYDIHDCFLHVAHSPVKTGSCGFKCHNGQNQTTGKVTLKNNIIITEDANGTSCYDILFHNGGISNTEQIEILMVGNVLKYYHNGITDIFAPSGYCFGNSVAAMNTLS